MIMNLCEFITVILTEADLGLLQHPRWEHFVIIVNGFQPLTIITKCSILNVEAALDPLLLKILFYNFGLIITFYLFSWVRSTLTNFASIHGFCMNTSKFCFMGI